MSEYKKLLEELTIQMLFSKYLNETKKEISPSEYELEFNKFCKKYRCLKYE